MTYSWIIAISALLLGIVAAYHALTFKRDPRSALGWVFISLTVPFGGPLAYYLFGVNRVRTRAQKLGRKDVIFDQERGGSIEPLRQSGEHVLPSSFKYLQNISDKISRRPLRPGNKVIALDSGEPSYQAMLSAIESAQHRIVLASYIFDTGAIGKRFVTALADARQRGVDIRVLLDGIGEWYSSPRIGRALAREKIRFARFLPPRLWPPAIHLNLRNHRKLLIVDGTIGFTGGMNIGDRHVGTKVGSSGIVDRHFQLQGPVVRDLESVFFEDWLFATNEQTPDLGPLPVAAGAKPCRVVTDGPGEDLDKLSLILHAVIATARDSVWIETPYFLPSRELITAIQIAALRGAEVNILVPENNNLPFVDWASRNLLWELLLLGVKVYYQPGAFVHSKLLIVDNHYAQIGSANLDARSLRLNFEVVVEIIDETFAMEQVSDLEKKRDQARQITLDELDKRRFFTRLRDGIAWLASPYL